MNEGVADLGVEVARRQVVLLLTSRKLRSQTSTQLLPPPLRLLFRHAARSRSVSLVTSTPSARN